MPETSLSDLDPEQLRELLSVAKEPEALGPAEEGVSSSMSPKLGSWIDQYKLVERLGEGGMAIVYLAEQEYPVHRKVALKIIKPGMNSTKVIARFEAERQTLTFLNHPNIAQIYDAGTTKDGLPYFVMEYVKGLPITEYCDNHKLTVKERLRLFQQVCHAVQHAHQKGIIHRDIKPSNILVSMHSDQAVPKIIDFGIAKAIDQPLTKRTLITEDSQLLGTPEYMSPEQADMAGEDIDTRSDIYSLGVLLYVLLTGVLPFDSDTLREGGLDHVRKVIRETDPKTPSTRLSKLGEEANKVAESRRTEVAALAKCLHRELEWIPLKAMRKDRVERYRSASELADDIENYLKGSPLIAGPLTFSYRFKKFVRRNKALVSGVLAVVVALTAGFIVSTALYFRAERLRVEAQLIADFLENDVLGSVSRARVGEATVSFVLDEAAKSLEGKFKDRPLIEASIRIRLSGTYRDLGEVQKAEQHQLDAIRIYEQHYGQNHAITQGAKSNLGWICEDQGRYYEMERIWTNDLKFNQRMSSLKRQVGSMRSLAVTYYHLSKYKEAESMFEKILNPRWHEVKQEEIRLQRSVGCNLARVYAAQGRYEEAERLFLERIGTDEWPEEYNDWRRVYSSDLANMYREQDRHVEAERLLNEVLEAQRLKLGDRHLHTLMSMYVLVRLYIDQDRYDKANTLLSEALPIARVRLRKEHPLTLRFLNAFAVLCTKQEQYGQSEAVFDEALKGRQRELGDDHPDTLQSKNDLAVLYKEQGDYDKAEPLLLEASKGRRLKLGDTHPHTKESLENLIDLYEAWNKPEKAEEWGTKLTQTKAVME